MRGSEFKHLNGSSNWADSATADCYASSTWTLPAHTTLLSGLDAYEHDTVRRGDKVADGQETITADAQSADYTTALISENATFGTGSGFGRSMDIVDEDIHLKRWIVEQSPIENVSEKSVAGALTAVRDSLIGDDPLKTLLNVGYAVHEKGRERPATEFPHHGERGLNHLSHWLTTSESLFAVANILDAHNPHHCPPDGHSLDISDSEIMALDTASDNRKYLFGDSLPDGATTHFNS